MFGLFKRKNITILNKEELINSLSRIIELLQDSDFNEQADAVRKPLEYLIIDDKDNFLKYLMTVEIWGGAGAAWEVAPFATRQKTVEFETHFINLVDLMKQCGIKSSKASSVAKYFRNDIKIKD